MELLLPTGAMAANGNLDRFPDPVAAAMTKNMLYPVS